eukprot:scaffold2262_cov262-Pinguiococcus_pyrenoidosus.AAC.2
MRSSIRRPGGRLPIPVSSLPTQRADRLRSAPALGPGTIYHGARRQIQGHVSSWRSCHPSLVGRRKGLCSHQVVANRSYSVFIFFPLVASLCRSDSSWWHIQRAHRTLMRKGEPRRGSLRAYRNLWGTTYGQQQQLAMTLRTSA